jgi:hypothetical protein
MNRNLSRPAMMAVIALAAIVITATPETAVAGTSQDPVCGDVGCTDGSRLCAIITTDIYPCEEEEMCCVTETFYAWCYERSGGAT